MPQWLNSNSGAASSDANYVVAWHGDLFRCQGSSLCDRQMHPSFRPSEGLVQCILPWIPQDLLRVQTSLLLHAKRKYVIDAEQW